MKVVRSGDTFTGYTSPDGSAWTQIGSPVTISGMSDRLEAGLALSAAGYGSLNTTRFEYVSVSPSGDGLAATYFDNKDFTGTTVAQTDPLIKFHLEEDEAPAPQLAAYTFAAEWKGQVLAPETGTYTFTTYADDGVRLWIDDQLVIDNWNVQSPTAADGQIALTAGVRYNLRLEYFQNYGEADVQLSWVVPGAAGAVTVPTDNLYASGNDSAAPTAPTLTAEAQTNPTRVALTWTASANADGYTLYRSPDGGFSEELVAELVTAAGYTDATADAGMGYVYRVVAIGAGGRASSQSVLVYTNGGPTAPVSNLTATAIAADQVVLAWTPPLLQVGAYPITGFSILVSADAGQTFVPCDTAPADAASHVVTGLDATTPYVFQVLATDAQGTSDPAASPTDDATTTDEYWADLGDPFELAPPATPEHPLAMPGTTDLPAGEGYRLLYAGGALYWGYMEGYAARMYRFQTPDATEMVSQTEPDTPWRDTAAEAEHDAAGATVPLGALTDDGDPGPLYGWIGITDQQGVSGGVLWRLQKRVPVVSIASYSGTEAREGSGTSARVVLTRDATFDAPLSVSLTVGGTAGADDFSSTPALGAGTVTFGAGESELYIDVLALPDPTYEYHESVGLTIGSGAGYVVGDADEWTVDLTDDPPQITSMTAKDAIHPSRQVATTETSAHPVLYLGTDEEDATIEISAEVLPETAQGSDEIRWAVDDPNSTVPGEQIFDSQAQSGALPENGTTVTLTLDRDFDLGNEALVGVGVDADLSGDLDHDEIACYVRVVLVKIDSLTALDLRDTNNRATNGPNTDLYVLEWGNKGRFSISPTVDPPITDAGVAGFLRWKVDGDGVTSVSYPQDGFAETISGTSVVQRDFTHGIADVTATIPAAGSNRIFTVSLGFDFDGDGAIDTGGEVFRTLTVHVVRLVLSDVTYSAVAAADFFPVSKDDGSGSYGAVAWKDKNGDGTDDPGDNHFPVAYKTNAKMVLAPTFTFLGGTPNWATSVTVRGAPVDGAGNPVYPEYTFDPTAATITGGSVTSANWARGPFQNWIDRFDPFRVAWDVSYDGGATWYSAGKSSNRVYVLLNPPTTTLLNTVAYLATGQPKGETTAAGVIAATWSEFADNVVWRPASDVLPSVQMLYSHAQPPGFASTAAGMIARRDGRGQCTAWTDLFISVLAANGVATGATSTRLDRGLSPYLFRVKVMPAQGSTAYTTTDFQFHQVVVLNGWIYDPSYGTLTKPIPGDYRPVELIYEDDVLRELSDNDGGSWFPEPKRVVDLNASPPFPP